MNNILIDDIPYIEAAHSDELYRIYTSDIHEQDDDRIYSYDSIIRYYDDEDVYFNGSMMKPYGYVDIDEMLLFNGDEGRLKYEETIDDGDDMYNRSEGHPLIRPYKPIGPFHFFIVLHPHMSLPQTIGPDIIEEISSIFDVFQSDSLCIGFNSLNAGAVDNKLHVECLVSEHIDGFNGLLLEKYETKILLESNLKCSNLEEEVYSYNTV